MLLAAATAAIAVIAATALVVALHVVSGGSRIHITAYFNESNGIYAGNHVDILGLPVGSVSSVMPEPSRVKVVLSLPADTKVPLDAEAFIVPPSVISDRYVGLSPAWNGSGPTMPDGYVLPVSRTHEPAEFDQLVGSLTTLFNALGPKEAGAKGAVGRLIKVLSENLDGNGQNIRDSIEGLSSATTALTADGGAFAVLIKNLDSLSQNLASRTAKISSFEADLAAATEELAKERGDITSVVDNLSTGLLALASFIRSHRDALHGDVHDLAIATSVLLRHQRALIETLDNLPLGAQNLARVGRNGAIIVRHADVGQSYVINNQLRAQICAALGPVCNLLTGERSGSQSQSTGLEKLFGAQR
ncbi:MAG TPA: MCE family protein [Mycobacteriales bacterium]|nr:MCE family protein [Mycobacteriales bacterium]